MEPISEEILEEVIKEIVEDLPEADEFDTTHVILLVTIIEDAIRSYIEKKRDRYLRELDEYFKDDTTMH